MLRPFVISLKALSACLVIWLSLLPSATAQAQAQGELKLQPGIGWGGVGFYTPQKWGVVRSSVVNSGGSEATGLLAITTKASGNVQFAKEIWLPSNTKLDVLTPVRLDRLASSTDRGVGAGATLLATGGGSGVLASDEGMLNVRVGGFETAVIAGTSGERLTAMAAALRESSGLPPTTAYLNARAAPAFPPAWDAISLLVLGEPQPDLDPAQLEALRRFLVGGGRMWVDLTRVDPTFMARLLGEEWNVSVIDRVGLTDFAIEGPGSPPTGPPRVTSDYPIDHVRVVAPDMETLHSINGYPATLRKAVGRGTLLLVTLEPNGWLEGKVAGPSLRSMSWLLRGSIADETEVDTRADVLRAVASEQIGYSVIGRVPVAIVLGVFALALLSVGIFLSRRGDLARLGWIAPVVAVVASAVLLGVGLARQSRVPFTLAAAEILEVAPDTSYAQATTFISVFRPIGSAGGPAVLRGEGEPTWPDLRTHGGQNVRIVWNGERSWHYENLDVNEGMVQTAQRQTVAALASPLIAAVELTAEGLRGTVDTSELGKLEDAVILTPQGKLTVTMGDADTFSAPAIDPLGPNQYFEGSVLGQRQMARQEAYRQLVGDHRFIDRPVLAGWVENTTSRVEVSNEAERRARALVVVPLTIAPAKSGTAIAVPPPLMRMRPFRGNKELMSAPIYDERTRDWVPSVSNAQTALMAFDLPAGVDRMKVTSARMTVDLTASGRPYEVVVYGNDAVRTVASGESPAGLLTFELTDANAPQPLPDGSVVVGIRIGEPINPLSPEPWSLTRMELGVSGTAE